MTDVDRWVWEPPRTRTANAILGCWRFLSGSLNFAPGIDSTAVKDPDWTCLGTCHKRDLL
jgi:hypothetical protein